LEEKPHNFILSIISISGSNLQREKLILSCSLKYFKNCVDYIVIAISY